MPQSSINRTTLKKTYERTLLSLLDTDSSAMLSSDSAGCCGSESKRFEKDLERLLRESDFALEMLEQFLMDDAAATTKHRKKDSPNTGGFYRLMSECQKFLVRSRTVCYPNSPDGGESVGKMVDAAAGFRPENVNYNRKPDYIERCRSMDANGNELGYDDHVTVRADDDGKAMDLVQAARCLAGLITMTESQSFESLLASVCFRRNRRTTNRPLGLLILESILATNGIQDAADLRNLRLGFGETPLVLAVRARDPDVVLSLLRHGADATRGWMGLANALEVLLFSPNQVFLEPYDIDAVERCLEYLLRVMPSVDVEALAAKEASGYYALLPHWRRALPAAMERSWRSDSIPVPSLQHLCRCVVRQSMGYLGHRLPEGLHSLSLPLVIGQFLRI